MKKWNKLNKWVNRGIIFSILFSILYMIFGFMNEETWFMKWDLSSKVMLFFIPLVIAASYTE